MIVAAAAGEEARWGEDEPREDEGPEDDGDAGDAGDGIQRVGQDDAGGAPAVRSAALPQNITGRHGRAGSDQQRDADNRRRDGERLSIRQPASAAT